MSSSKTVRRNTHTHTILSLQCPGGMGGRGCDWVGLVGRLQMQARFMREERDAAGDLTDRPLSPAQEQRQDVTLGSLPGWVAPATMWELLSAGQR